MSGVFLHHPRGIRITNVAFSGFRPIYQLLPKLSIKEGGICLRCHQAALR